MPTILGVDIGGIAAAALGSRLLPATITRITPGTYDPANPASGNRPTTSTASCRAAVTKFEQKFLKDDQVRVVTGEVIVLLATVSPRVTPAVGDSITIVCPDNVSRTLNVNAVTADPASAQATCKVAG